MRAKIASRLLILVMAMLMTALPVWAEGCALCGQETGGDTYLCADCLTGLLAEQDVSGGLSIGEAALNGDGSVTLTWQDTADNGPYNVYYELMQASSVPFGWTAGSGVQGGSITLNQLVPGVSYVFTVEDASGHRVQYRYYAPAVTVGNEIGAKIRIHTKVRYDDKDLYLPFSAGEIMQDNGKAHGLYLKMAYFMLRATREYAFSLTVEAPNGFADTVLGGGLTLNYGKSEVPAWGFISLEDYFDRLERCCGSVPAGEYRVMMNFDGKPAYAVSFEVRE